MNAAQAPNPYAAPGADIGVAADEATDLTPFYSARNRFGRLSYLTWTMATMIAFVLTIGPIGAFAGGAGFGDIAAVVVFMLYIPLFVLLTIYGIRRLHDFNRSGWWWLFYLVPVANLVLSLVLLFAPGTSGTNRYGPARVTPGWERVLGYFFAVLYVVGLVGGILAAILLPAMVG